MANDLTSVIDKLMARSLLALRAELPILRYLNTSFAEQASVRGSTITVPIPSAIQTRNVVPGQVNPGSPDLALTDAQIQLNNWKEAPFYLNDQDVSQISVRSGYLPAQVSEAVSALADDIAASVYANYPKIWGYWGNPDAVAFADKTPEDAAELERVLTNQRCPIRNRVAIISPTVKAKRGQVPEFANANVSGSPAAVAMGGVDFGYNFTWETGNYGIPVHTAGTIGGTGSDTVVTGAVTAGATTVGVTVGATNGLNVVAGDIVSFAGNTQSYAITAPASAAAAGSTTLNISPPLVEDLSGSEAVTLVGDQAGGGKQIEVNLGMHRDCMAFASVRLDADILSRLFGAELQVQAGAGGIDVTRVDPETNLALRLIIARGHYLSNIAFSAMWGTDIVRPEYGARLVSQAT